MNKRGISNHSANKLATIFFFLSALVALNAGNNSIVSNILGILFMITAVYGVVCIFKKKEFIF